MSVFRGFAIDANPIFKSNFILPQLASVELIDIGANLLDDMFDGYYNGKKAHDGDMIEILHRSKSLQVKSIITTAGTLDESRTVLQFCRDMNILLSENPSSEVVELPKPIQFLYSTAGIHPTRCSAFDQNSNIDSDVNQGIITELESIIIDGIHDQTIVAIGELGLDYDRLKF
eukprot:gene943-1324_t